MERPAVIVCLSILIAPLAVGDPHNYIQAGTGDVHVICGTGAVPGVGGVCIATDHVTGDSSGEATLSIVDASMSPTSGFYCQDSGENGICGDGNDPGILFCGSVTISSGDDWDEDLPIVVRVNGPVFGVPLLSPCGTLSVGTIGSVTHSA